MSNPQLKIPYDILEDHIQCSICLTAMRGSVLTPCGHRYCYKCISEWIGREHSCPCCKKQIQTNGLYYDVQFDSLVEQILLHRDKAEQEHFDQMFEQVTKCEEPVPGTSTFHDILRKHLKKSMISIEQYFHKLRQDFNQQVSLLQSGIIPSTIRDKCSNPEDARVQLGKRLEESETMAADALDKFLGSNIPSLDFLPVIVDVYINDKQIRIPNITVKPNDCVSDLKIKIEQIMNGRRDVVTTWNATALLFLISPLAKRDHYDLDALLQNPPDDFDVAMLSWETQPILKHFMKPGSEIVFHKAFTSQSDEPLKCYVQLFKDKGAHPVDYFSCEDCNSKWICKSCVQGCHTGHTVNTFVLQHVPSWGCCYCPKKKLCKIQQNG